MHRPVWRSRFAPLQRMDAAHSSPPRSLRDRYRCDVPALRANTYSFTGIVSNDICPFPLTIDGTVAIDERQFFDQTGARTAIDRHSVEQDTFSANGKSLTGLPITYNVFHPFNSDGNNTDVFTDGVLERVRLPDGGLFISARRVDFTGNGPDFTVTPDNGATVNLAGFCIEAIRTLVRRPTESPPSAAL